MIENEIFVGQMDSNLVKLQLEIMLAMGMALATGGMPRLRTSESVKKYTRYFKQVGSTGVEKVIRGKLARTNSESIIVQNKFPYDYFDAIKSLQVAHYCIWWDQASTQMTPDKMRYCFNKEFGLGASIYSYENIKTYMSVPGLSHGQVFVVGSKRRV